MGFFDGIVNSVTNAVSDIGLKDVVAPLIGGAAGLIGGTQANNANWDIAQANNNWSAQQFATRYQTTVKDLQAAGLNPMLAYGQGGGTPPSAQSVPARQNLGSEIMSGASNAIQAKNAATTNALLRAQINKTDEEADNIASQTVNNRDTNPNIKQQLNNLLAENEYIRMRSRMTRAQAMEAENLLPRSKAEGGYYNQFGWSPFALRDLGSAANSAANVFGAIKGTSAVPLTTNLRK
jgi:hypothetical protein